MGFAESDSLFEFLGAIERLPWVIDEISELIVIGFVTEGPPSRGIYLDFRIFLGHQGFHWVSIPHMRFLGWRTGLRDASVEAIVSRVSFVWSFVRCRGRDTAIGLGSFCRTLTMRSVQLLMWLVALSKAGRWALLTLMADSQMAFEVSLPDKHPMQS